MGCASEDGHVYFWDLVEVRRGRPGASGVPLPQGARILTPPLIRQGSLALSLPVGRGVVQSLDFHPSLPCLLAATQGQVQLWREDGFQPEEGDEAAPT